jgi:RimJ/RimL family protein N-acetyltransferase
VPLNAILPLPVGHTLPAGAVWLQVPGKSDLGFIRRLWADPETMEPVGGPLNVSPDAAADWYERWVKPGSADRAYWLVMSGDGPAGEISIRGYDPRERVADLNLKIAASTRGHGYGRQALRGLLPFFFHDLVGTSLVDDVAPGNAAGQSLLLSEGFERDPSATDVCRLVLSRAQWNVTRSRSGT